MADLIDPDHIEQIVGAKRHPTRHIGRADSASQTVYILHADDCAARKTHRPLTECKYSRSLDLGIDPARWEGHEDQPVFLGITAEARLIPRDCALPHDPEPWLTSGMAMAQVSWWGAQKWSPRDEYCQDNHCLGYPHNLEAPGE